ncbi:MAG: response regulator [Gemmataceae bacterium]|nr:response regulator [Gemmataceae bacterium]
MNDRATDKSVVLVVDDDPAVRRVVELMVGLLGRPVAAVPDGAAAVAAFAADPGAVAAVILDVRMPGMDGPETLAALREIDPRVRCLFMTGDAGDQTDDDLLALGAEAVLRKPFRSHQLAAALAPAPHPVGS